VRPGDLDRQVPDTAAGPVDQHPVACRHLGGVHQGRPDLITASTGFTPTARTRTSTSVGNGTGRSTSVNSSTSGPPKACWRIACMVADNVAPPSGLPATAPVRG